MSNSYQHIDLSYLESITDGSLDIIKELIAIFVEQVPEFTEDFADGMANKDWKKIAAAAHKAKSSVVSMGINNLGNIDLKNLELLTKQLYVDELVAKGESTSELEQLQKVLASYPEDKKQWIAENKNEETVIGLIKKFDIVCEEAVEELNQVLDK
ncbi:Hpt domain-containing protein [Carboxylicivirga sp. N1Y90]|uniref:Hpt domain-containing protein n=1 Tax=Carboxylicivirga fragile TaxID=3417571 RepID=UPI003D340CED|nr:Hpt domain-containing protein [Marinilabiliaceae bacterium N1Y90]